MLRLLVVGVLELWLVKLSLKALGIDGFGLYNVVGGIVLVMNVINTAMSTTAYRYIAVEIGKKKGNPNEVFCLNFFIYVFLCAIFLVVAEPLGLYYVNNYLVVPEGMLEATRFVFHVSVFTTIISMLMIPYQGVLVAMENFKIKIVAEVIWTFIKIVGLLIMLRGGIHSIQVYSIIMLIAAIVRALINVIYTSLKYKDLVRLKIYRNRKLCKEMLLFNNYILMGASVSIYKSNGAAMILNFFYGTTINAAFAVANRVHLTINMFAENLNTAAIPQTMKSFGGGDEQRSETLVNYISKYSFYLLFVIVAPIYCQLPFILDIWLGTIPPYTLLFCRIIIIMNVLGGLGRGIPALVQATGEVKWFQIVGSLIQFLTLPIIILLYNTGFPPETMLIVFCVSSLIGSMTSLYLLYRIIQFDVKSFVKTSYLRALYVFLALFPLVFWFSKFNVSSVGSFLFSTIVIEIYLALSIWLFGLERKERSLVLNFVHKIIKKTK